MINSPQNLFTRIAVFYDGYYFQKARDHYRFGSSRKAYISIRGLHDFILHEVAKAERTHKEHCQIVEAHCFMGRKAAEEAGLRFSVSQNKFEDVLIDEGVSFHILPIGSDSREKGVDVWLGIEVYRLAAEKCFDVCVLISGDGDFVPLVRKVQGMGMRVMVLCWDYERTDKDGNRRDSHASQSLLDSATYPIMVSSAIDDRARKRDFVVQNLFEPPPVRDGRNRVTNLEPERSSTGDSGRIASLSAGYGHIDTENGMHLSFPSRSVKSGDFRDLNVGDSVEYIAENTPENGLQVLEVRKVFHESSHLDSPAIARDDSRV